MPWCGLKMNTAKHPSERNGGTSWKTGERGVPLTSTSGKISRYVSQRLCHGSPFGPLMADTSPTMPLRKKQPSDDKNYRSSIWQDWAASRLFGDVPPADPNHVLDRCPTEKRFVQVTCPCSSRALRLVSLEEHLKSSKHLSA